MSNLESAGEDLSGARTDDEPLPRVREGLPPTYRMRADSHYVDLLSSRPAAGRERLLSVRDIQAAPFAEPSTIRPLVDSIARHGVLQPLLVQNHLGQHRLIAGHRRLSAAHAAGVVDVPCRVYDVDDEEAARLASAAHLSKTPGPAGSDAGEQSGAVNPPIDADADLEKTLMSLAACTDFVSGAESELSRTVANTLLRAEVWRATGLLKATRTLRQESPALRTSVAPRKVLDQVLSGFAAERRLRLIEFDVRSSLPQDGVMICDERLLSIALASAVRTILTVCADLTSPSIKIVATVEPGDVMMFTISQNIVTVSDTWFARAFDAGWVDRPGGQASLVSMLAVKRAAEALGGQATVAPAGRGTAITISVPGGI